MEKRKISFANIETTDEDLKVVTEILKSNWLSEGSYVKSFESAFASYVGTKHCVAVNSGTSALICGLSSLVASDDFNVKAGSKVITTPLTLIATSNAIVHSKLDPIYIDIDKNSLLLSPEGIKTHLENVGDTSDYSMILPVHLMGYTADMDEINKIVKKFGLVVFEDAAPALGSIYNGKKAGTLSAAAAFSLRTGHVVSGVELGTFVTDNETLYNAGKSIKGQGGVFYCDVCKRKFCQFHTDYIGFNFRVTEFQAALALNKLKTIDSDIKKIRENVKYLNDCLQKFSDVLQLPTFSKDVSYFAYPMVINDRKISRDKLVNFLQEKCIEVKVMFPCIPTQQTAYSHLKESYSGKLPNAEFASDNGLFLSCSPHLSADDLDYMASAIEGFLTGKN